MSLPVSSCRKLVAEPSLFSGLYLSLIHILIFMAQVKDPVKALMEMDETKDTRRIF